MMLISFSLLFISTLTIGHNTKIIHNLNLFRKCNPDICWGKCASIPGPKLAAIIRSEIQAKFKQVLESYSSFFPAVFGKTKSRCST